MKPSLLRVKLFGDMKKGRYEDQKQINIAN
jgi:hypothetical protein